MNSGDQISKALARIGSDTNARDAIISALKKWESEHQVFGEEVRESVTGPIVDALFQGHDEVSRRLSNGLVFSLPYRSKIGREFAMADEPPAVVWEPQTSQMLANLAKDADTVIIGGAYAGDHALLMMAEMAKRGGVCHCFEPNEEQAKALERNATRNGLDNLGLLKMGLWNRSERLVMVGSDSHAHPEVAQNDTKEAFQAISIDDYCREQDIGQLDVIMLDIEGGEFAALEGAEGFLSQPADAAPEIIFEIHRSYVDWSDGILNTDIARLLTGNGYELFAIRDYQGNVLLSDPTIEVIPVERCYLEGPPHGFNIFATKRTDAADRLGLRMCVDVSPKLLFHRDPALHQPIPQ